MSDAVVVLPELKVLKKRLRDPYWINYYNKVSTFKGPIESVNFYINFKNNT